MHEDQQSNGFSVASNLARELDLAIAAVVRNDRANRRDAHSAGWKVFIENDSPDGSDPAAFTLAAIESLCLTTAGEWNHTVCIIQALLEFMRNERGVEVSIDEMKALNRLLTASPVDLGSLREWCESCFNQH